MNKHFQKIWATIVLFIISFSVKAQSTPGAEDVMRGSGKIYVVVAVCLTILLGLFLYVFSIDRKISKIEKEK
jgi:multisubunit Na+/H+ antiporter MnhB subunit